MTVRSPLFRLLAGVAVLLALSAMFLSGSPPPANQPQGQAAPSRELDEAAEEVRAVATGMRRLQEMIADQGAQIQSFGERLQQVRHRVEQLERREPEPATAPEPAPPASPASEDTVVLTERETPFDLATLTSLPAIGEVLDIEESSVDRTLTWLEPVRSGQPPFRAPTPDAPSGEQVDSGELRFFIPPAVLSGLSLTALVGRIPRGGSVQDPWPFLVVSQADNLTANGLRLPQLRGILWRGVVRGDAVLSCASASLRSMVYVFEDGVFHVAKAPDQEGFGYLADKAGNPCLTGKLHSTAPQELGTRLLASILAGAGGAYAESQVERTTANGTETASVRGDPFRYLLGQSVQGAATTYGEYLLHYANDSWDAVVVPAGRAVDIHITSAIPVTHSPTQRIHENLDLFSPEFAGGLD